MINNNSNNKKPTVLMILDGWGIAPPSRGNAVTLAKPKFIEGLLRKYPHTLLCASGKCVGLPPYQDGNSEAGHMNIGAGRMVEQDAVRISKDINTGNFFKNDVLLKVIKHVKRYNSSVHLMGLLTETQSAHADPDHLWALLSFLRGNSIKKIFLHLFTDGRDSPQYIAIILIERLIKALKRNEKIASICGRFYAMDRVKEWSRTHKAYDAIVLGKGVQATSAKIAITHAYNSRENDEYITPTVIVNKGKPVGSINDNDAVIFFNLRSDRVRELTKAFVQDDLTFLGFKREKTLKNLKFVTLTGIGPDLPNVFAAYPSQNIANTIPFILKDYRQLYIAESEKFAHVTYFFNGGYASPVAGEERVLVKSPKVISYANKPHMNARHLTDIVVSYIKNNNYNFIVINFANPDMVGHTGDLKAGIKAVQFIDQCICRVVKAVLKKNGLLFITADHGNIEEMIDLKTGEIDTTHSANPVPFIIVKKGIKKIRLRNGKLADIAPTIIDFLKLEKPKDMSGINLCQ